MLRVGGLFRKQPLEQDLCEELEGHLALEIEDGLRRGLTSEEARRQALIKLGGIQPAKELYRNRRGVPFIDTTLQDVRYGLRTLTKNPGFALVAIATLALGVAVNTTIFSLVSGILLRKPPIHDPGGVVIVSSSNQLKPGSHFDATVTDYMAWRAESRAFRNMAATTFSDFTLTGGSEPQHVPGLRATAEYFRVLGVTPAIGRAFLGGEDQAGHDHVVILSDKLWHSRFNGDPTIVGKTINLDGEPHSVIGVMPAKFRLITFDASLWTPLVFTPQQSTPKGQTDSILSVVARLKAGVTPQQAQAEMTAIARRLEERYPETNKNRSVQVVTLQEFMIEDANVRNALVVLGGAVFFVLLIGCTNIANLLLARNSVRQRELTIRAAVGAGRLRLIRQLLIESILIGVFGGAAGLLLAVAGTALVRARLTWNEYVQVMASEMTIDLPVLTFCLLVSLGAALFFGLIPALQASKLDLNAVLNESARGGSAGGARLRLRSVLVVCEIALSIILLAGAGMLIEASLAEAHQVLGFDSRNVLTMEIRLSGARYEQPGQQTAFFRSVLSAADKLPGIDKVSVTSALPITASAGGVTFQLEGREARKDLQARHYVVGPDYFQAMGIPLIKGRGFLASDDNRSVVVINQQFADAYFTKQDPIGQRVRLEAGDTGSAGYRQIVGVVGAVSDFYGQSQTHPPQVYETFFERPQARMTVVAKTKSDPVAFTAFLRQAIWSVDKDQPIETIQSMSRVVDDNSAGDNLMGWMMGTFAGLALLLAAVGIFGVMAYNVAQRTREVGIRMALGAGKREVLRLVVGQSGWLTGAGLALGLLGAYPVVRLLTSMFGGLPVAGALQILASVATVVATVSLVASYIPARRATRVEPMVALHHE